MAGKLNLPAHCVLPRTVGLEVEEDLPGVQAVLVPVGGGGLISGVEPGALPVAALLKEKNNFGTGRSSWLSPVPE